MIGTSIEREDLGGGYLFLHPNNGRYYIGGIMSVRILANVSASLLTSTIFHKHWIEKNLKLFNKNKAEAYEILILKKKIII